MPDQVQELLRIKEHVDQAKQERARLEGQAEQLARRLRDEFGCASAEEAALYDDELGREDAGLAQEIDEGVAGLKEELGW